jgi:hypothetical protein
MEVNKENSYIGQNNYFDYLVISICLIFLGASAYFFQYKLKSREISSGPSLGRIVTFSNDIRLKKKEDLVWNPLQFNDKLRENDSVFSGDDSQVVLDLLDVGLLQLSSNSMIKILKEKDEPVLDLSSGTIQVKNQKGKTISLRDQGKKIKLQVEPGDYKFTKNQSALNIAVFSGQAKIEGRDELISANTELSIDKDQIKVKSFNYGFLNPVNESTIYTSDEKITFEVDHSCTESCSIVFSNNIDFSRKIKFEFPRDQKVFTLDLPLKGTIHFKLVNGSENDLTLPYVFHRKPWSTPKIISPIDNFHTKDNQVHFEWNTPVSPELKARIQISKDAEFLQLSLDKRIEQNFIDLDLQEGEFFWRVRFESDKSETDWSKVSKFIIDSNLIHPINLQIPPANLFLINGTTKLQLKIIRDFQTDYFVIKISKDDKILKIIRDTKDFYDISINSAGVYKISVESFFGNNIKNGQSNPLEIKVTPFEPLPAPDLHEHDQEIEIIDHFESSLIRRFIDFFIPSAQAESFMARLSWKPIQGAAVYRLEISSDQGFTKIILKENVSSSNFSWMPKKLGRYYWRVTPIDIYNFDGQTSRIGILNVHPHFSKIAPPKIEAKVLSRDDKSFTLNATWEELSRVSTYEMFITFFNKDNDKVGEDVLSTVKTKIKHKFLIPKNVSTINVTIKAISTLGSRTPFSVSKINLPPIVQEKEFLKPNPDTSKLDSLNFKFRLVQFSFEQFSMGSNWDGISLRVNNQVSNALMKNVSSRFFFQKDWGRIGAGLDYFYLLDGVLSISTFAIGGEYAYDFPINQKKSFYFSPLMTVFYAPSITQGIYGFKLNLPLTYFISNSLSFYAGLGYVYAQFFGIPPIQQILDINVSFGGLNMLGGMRFLF